MVDFTSHGGSLALLQGQLLAGEISHSAFLDRAAPLGAGPSEAAAVADTVLAIAANQAARPERSEIQLRRHRCSIGRSGFCGCAMADYANDHPIGFATGTCTGTCCRWSAARTTPSHGSPRTSLPPTPTACSEC
jgi:hypothetical protein